MFVSKVQIVALIAMIAVLAIIIAGIVVAVKKYVSNKK